MHSRLVRSALRSKFKTSENCVYVFVFFSLVVIGEDLSQLSVPRAAESCWEKTVSNNPLPFL